MKNGEIVDAFVQALLQDPEHVMQAVAMRLSLTRYEMKLLKQDPFREFDHPDPYQFPIQTGERSLAFA